LADALAEKAEIARLIRALPELLDDPELASRKNRLMQFQKSDPDAVARSAEKWYCKVRDQYADVPTYEGSKKTLGESAESGLFALHNLTLGEVAPDIEGEDLDGKQFRLTDYRGKVVVLIFSGHWCGPCRQMNPQKQQLVERYSGKPFVLLEVNSDEDREAVKRIMRKEKLTWHCWFDGGHEGLIDRRWGVHSWPTIFLLDGKGVIRYKELRVPMLDRVVDRLLKETEDGK
jgi:thiol-disulfide isomerase/thioredoxin